MELTAFETGYGWLPPWVFDVSPADVLTGGELVADDELPCWDDPDPAELTAAGLGPELAPSAAWSVAEVLFQVAAAGLCGHAMTLLTSVAGRALAEDERLSVIQLWQPLLAWAAGTETQAWAEFAGPAESPPSSADGAFDVFSSAELAAAELGPALHCSTDHAKERIAQARALSPGGLFAATGERLRGGQLSDYRARLVLEELQRLDPAVAVAAQDAVLDRAATLSPTRLRRLIRRTGKRLVGRRAPETVLDDFVASQRTRRVWFDTQAEDNLVFMGVMLPPLQAMAIQQHLLSAAGGRESYDGRCQQERMVDLLVGSILGSEPDRPATPLAPKVRLNVLVPLDTLLSLGHTPGDLSGYGDLPAELVRGLAGDAQWCRWVFDPVDGHLLDQGRQSYTPNAALAGYLKARDGTCRFPGSHRSASLADLDHNQPYDMTGEGNGGATSADNMFCLSRAAHRIKTHGGHHYRHHGNGIIGWTTRLGRTYITRPQDYRPDDHGNGAADGDPPEPELS